MKASLVSQSISAGSLLSSGGGFLGLSNERKGPASYIIINFPFFVSIYNGSPVYVPNRLTAYELLFPLKPKNPI
ncbi:hypothetical protein GCM10011386_44910 [Parapedobacter defluvii]|uniref:Uncharacterized protein n=1 Tax=Parapedobacter defluvii TaxID=2045106 RepID=A0ABQ1MW63_9SPHI|nr:hypothetical protein GCM10011386_44910 [Parapedobacter defluvii]